VKLSERLVVKPGARVRLAAHDSRSTVGVKDKAAARRIVQRNIERLSELQQRLYAENRRALLVVLQGMDASGKDGTIRHVMSGVNPMGCRVTAFKVPSTEEADHDFLWRIHRAMPPRGEIGIFNRSHYEDVLVVRVHQLVSKAIWSKRYEQINRFERFLADNGVTILKFFLHISKEEQRRRFDERLKDPAKNWKFSATDVAERRYWDAYMRAYEDALSCCSTPWAVVPSDKKWFRDLAVSQIIVETLEAMDPRYPTPLYAPSSVSVS